MDVNEDEPAKWTWRPKPTCLKKTCGSLDREHKLNSWKRPPESPDGTQERLKVECYHNGVHGSTWWPDPQLHHIWLWTRLAGHHQIARRRFRHFRLQSRQQAGVHGLLPGQVLRPESFEKDRFQVRNMSEKETDYVSLVYISHFNVVKCREDKTTHFEFRVQPSKDTTMQIELFFNCKLLDHGSRLKMTNDFAFFSLDSSDVYARYQCGYHLLGKQRCRRSLHHHHSLLRGQRGSQRRNSTPRRRSRLEQIQRFEDFLLLSSGRPNADEGGNAPVFTSQFQNVTSPDLTNLLEGDIAHFEATLRSRSDHDGRIIFNGQFLKLGPRERTVHAFGMVVLEIIGTKFKDSDIYTYRYSTTFISFFKYKDRYNIFENFWRAGLATNETWLKFGIRQAGHWLRPVGSHDSGGNICKSSVPTSLASLFSSLTPPRRIQWIHNGHQFGSGPRIRMLDDFGFVVLVLDWIFPLDARETVCRATNTGQSCLLSSKPSATSFWTAANPILGQVITAEKLRDLERGLVTERFTEDVPVKTPRFTL